MPAMTSILNSRVVNRDLSWSKQSVEKRTISHACERARVQECESSPRLRPSHRAHWRNDPLCSSAAAAVSTCRPAAWYSSCSTRRPLYIGPPPAPTRRGGRRCLARRHRFPKRRQDDRGLARRSNQTIQRDPSGLAPRRGAAIASCRPPAHQVRVLTLPLPLSPKLSRR